MEDVDELDRAARDDRHHDGGRHLPGEHVAQAVADERARGDGALDGELCGGEAVGTVAPEHREPGRPKRSIRAAGVAQTRRARDGKVVERVDGAVLDEDGGIGPDEPRDAHTFDLRSGRGERGWGGVWGGVVVASLLHAGRVRSLCAPL